MEITIENFESFMDSNISGKFIVNPYWLEHLLNLFSQGYIGEIWDEIQNTKMNHCDTIERLGYGTINLLDLTTQNTRTTEAKK